MNINKAFPSKYLKVSDLDDVDVTCTIVRIALEDVGQGDEMPKPVIYFEELHKGLVCNKTNATTIAKFYGDDTNEWLGRRITLWTNHDVQFMNDIVSAIRVRSRPPTSHVVDPVLSDPVGQPVRQSEQDQHIEDPQTPKQAEHKFISTILSLNADVHVNKLLGDFGYVDLEHVPVVERQSFIVFVQSMAKRAVVT